MIQLDRTLMRYVAGHDCPFLRPLLLVVTALLTAVATAQGEIAPPDSPDDFQTVDAKRFGVSMRVPVSWRLALLQRDDRAFVLLLPQDDEDRPALVACEIAVAPSDLDDYRKRIDANAQRLPPGRTLLHNVIAGPKDDPTKRPSEGATPQLLDSLWEFRTPGGQTWFEQKIRRIENNQLYTFTLNADEAHFAAYAIQFRDVVADARFTQPDTGVQPLPGGYWKHRDLHFGLKLPEGWNPSFPTSKQAPFFATGPVHEVLADNLVVVPTRRQRLDLDRLIERFPAEIQRIDENAKVIRSTKVPQGDGEAVESVVETRRGPFRITVFQRRFEGKRRNYEINYTILSGEFEKLEAALKASADSFKEFPAPRRENAA